MFRLTKALSGLGFAVLSFGLLLFMVIGLTDLIAGICCSGFGSLLPDHPRHNMSPWTMPWLAAGGVLAVLGLLFCAAAQYLGKRRIGNSAPGDSA